MADRVSDKSLSDLVVGGTGETSPQNGVPGISPPSQPTMAGRGFTYEVETRYGTVELLSPRQLSQDEVIEKAQEFFDAQAERFQAQQEPTSWQELMTTVKSYRRPLMIAAGAGVGATRGAAIGAPFGPYGAVAGGLIGSAYGGAMGALGNVGMEALPPAPASLAPLGGSGARPSLADINREAAAGAVSGVEGQVYGNLLGAGAAASGALLTRGGARGAREAALEALARGGAAPPEYLPHSFRPVSTAQRITQDARGFGVDLSASEQVGVPFLRVMEHLAGRFPTGQNVIARLGQSQTEQLIRAGKNIADEFVGGPSLDQLTRNNRFLRFLKVTVDETKEEGNRLFAEAYNLLGARTPTNATNTVAVARALREELPTVGGQPVKGFGLGPLDDLVEKILGTNAEDKVRAILGLPQGAPLPPGTQISGATARGLTVAEMRKLQAALSPLAFPDRFEGAVVVDAAATRNARRLWGAVSDDLMEVAKQKGAAATAALENAKQYWAVQVRGMDGKFYADLLAANKDIGQLSGRLFNPANIGILVDAKKVVSKDGFKLIQQQWWDHVWNQSVKHHPSGSGVIFDGKRFADFVLNPRNKQVVSTLFDEETARHIGNFARVAQVAMPTASQRPTDFFGSFLGLTQIGAMGGLSGGLLSGNPSYGTLASGMTVFGPWVLAKLLMNPTTSSALTSMLRSGREWTPQMMADLLRAAIRFKAIVPPNPGEAPIDPRDFSGPAQLPANAGVNMPPSQLVMPGGASNFRLPAPPTTTPAAQRRAQFQQENPTLQPPTRGPY